MRIFTRTTSILACAALLASCGDGPAAIADATCGGGEIRLARGEAARLAPGAEPCALAPAAGAEYVLAHFDATAVRAARSADGERWRYEGTYEVTVEAMGDAPASGARTEVHAAPAAPLTPPDVHLSSVVPGDALSPLLRDRPWAVGDTFSTRLECPCPGGRSPVKPYQARVARVYDGWLVVATTDEADPAGTQHYLSALDAAAPAVFQHSVPMLRSVFLPEMPITSTGSRQMLVLLVPTLSPWAGYANANVSGDQVLAYIRLGVDFRLDRAAVVDLLTHEIAHTFQRGYMHGTRTSSRQESGIGAALWAVEGSADLMAWEAVRRAGGFPLDGNFDWRNPPRAPYAAHFAALAQPGTGELTRGYAPARGFLRDLVVRRVERGEGVDAAVREVARGALEGWYGYDREDVRRRGLVNRMQARIPGWRPEEAVLTWTLSHAGDDLTDNPVFQDRVSLRAWDLPDWYQGGWRPDGALNGPGTLTARRTDGSPGWLYVRDLGQGVRLRVRGGPSGMRWMILRTR